MNSSQVISTTSKKQEVFNKIGVLQKVVCNVAVLHLFNQKFIFGNVASLGPGTLSKI